jgi:hypothetical protein
MLDSVVIEAMSAAFFVDATIPLFSICFSHQTTVHFKLVESTRRSQDILTKTYVA